MVVRPGPLAKTLSGCLAERVYALPHEGKRRESNGLPFLLEMQATILPQNGGMSHFVERMGIFGQDSRRCRSDNRWMAFTVCGVLAGVVRPVEVPGLSSDILQDLWVQRKLHEESISAS